ncbi:MAG: hypothetical protein ACLVJ6_06490 [Merdibacter sp.]
MKSGKFGLSALAAMALLGGCSSSETTTTTCTSDEYGVTDVQKITAQDDQVIRLEERLEIDFADLGMTEEDMAAFTEDDLQALFESEMPELAEDIEGVTFDYAGWHKGDHDDGCGSGKCRYRCTGGYGRPRYLIRPTSLELSSPD